MHSIKFLQDYCFLSDIKQNLSLCQMQFYYEHTVPGRVSDFMVSRNLREIEFLFNPLRVNATK